MNHLILRKMSAFLLFLSFGVTMSFCQKSVRQSEVLNMQEPRIESSNSTTRLEDNILILSGNVVIRIPDSDTSYYLIKTENATYDKGKKIIAATNGIIETYKIENTDWIQMISFDTLKYDVASNRVVASNIKAKVRNP